MARVVSHSGLRTTALTAGWQLCRVGAAEVPDPTALEALPREWLAAMVPGTAAMALKAAGKFDPDAPTPLDDGDIWYRCSFDWPGGPDATLRLEGLATLCDVWLNGRHLLRSENMFHAHAVALSGLGKRNTLHLRFSSLLAWLKPKKGKVRWRPRMIVPSALRFARTTVLGRAPSWCPELQCVGPWRGIFLEEGDLRVDTASLRARVDGKAGELQAKLGFSGPAAEGLEAIALTVGEKTVNLRKSGPGQFAGTVRVDDAELWWPRSHGRAALYPVSVEAGAAKLGFTPAGFRRIELDRTGGGFLLRVNGERVFCRGTCWTTESLINPALHSSIWSLIDAGMNMVRVPGVAVYPPHTFFSDCDRLGVMVWQDFMFANFDYPVAEPGFRESVEREATSFLSDIQLSPSLAVLCGGSEVEQQAAMLGLTADERKSPLAEDWLPTWSNAGRPDVPYVTSSPSGGPLPFLSNQGCAHYYGVGAYRRPLEDARRAEVKFASECLGFANLPSPGAFADVPGWETRAPKDMGADDDFADVRDFYLELLFRVNAKQLKESAPARYAQLSAEVTGEVMGEVFSEWRRARSGCNGGLVWFHQDVWPSPGWGVVDARGVPKPAWYALQRVFAPRAVLLTDEGVNGLAVHVVNDRLEPLEATVELALLLEGRVPVAQAARSVKVAGNSALELSAYELLPGFIDVTHAYKFGPAAHHVTRATLLDASGRRLSEAVHFPQGRFNAPTAPVAVKVKVEDHDGAPLLELESDGFVQSVSVEVPGYAPLGGGFHLFPGRPARVTLFPTSPQPTAERGTLRAITLPEPISFDFTWP